MSGVRALPQLREFWALTGSSAVPLVDLSSVAGSPTEG